MRRLTKTLLTTAAAGLLVTGLTACEDDSTANQANKVRDASIDGIRKNQPVRTMDYSPTLETINRWSDTWGQEGAVAYVYMQRQDGTLDGYYVLDGLPVNYCVGGSPPYTMEDLPGDNDNSDKQVPAPGLDGAYYGGCDASRYYGFDAVTGQYIEYTDGFIVTARLSSQPLPLDKQPEPYVSSIEDVKNR